MTCEEMMNMPQLRDGLKLVAGASGVWRSIRWIYFADCMQCLKGTVPPQDLIHGQELVIVTDEKMIEDDEKVIDLIQAMMTKDIAGFVINEEQITQPVMDFCNEVELPLYELSFQLYTINVSHAIIRALIAEEEALNLGTRLLSTILYSRKLDTRQVQKQAESIGYDLTEKNRMVILRPDKTEASADETVREKRRESLKKIVESEFRAYGQPNTMILEQGDDVVFLLPVKLVEQNSAYMFIKDIIRKCEEYYKFSVMAGVGEEYGYSEDIRESFYEAESALRTAHLVEKKERVCFYSTMEIYSLIAQIPNGKFLDEFVEKRIGKLIEADRMQDSKLCETLEAYLENDCNANMAANELYIHRNTMRYRLDKIQKILDIENGKLSVYLELMLAFAIKRYREHHE